MYRANLPLSSELALFMFTCTLMLIQRLQLSGKTPRSCDRSAAQQAPHYFRVVLEARRLCSCFCIRKGKLLAYRLNRNERINITFRHARHCFYMKGVLSEGNCLDDSNLWWIMCYFAKIQMMLASISCEKVKIKVMSGISIIIEY